MRVPFGRMTRTAILAEIRDAGFDLPSACNPRAVAASVQLAARAGRLEWSTERLVSTLDDHLLDLRRVRPPRR